MTGLEAVEWLNENLFPDWKVPTGEQLDIWVKRLNGWPEGLLKDAMREHWLEHGKYKEPVLTDILNLAKQMKPKPVVRVDGPSVKVRIVDFIRRECGYGATLAGRDNAGAIEFHFRKCWAAVVAGAADEMALNFGRRLTCAYCRIALMEIGWDEPAAVEMAREVVGLKPGEQMPKVPKVFREMPRPMRQTPFEALKALAIGSPASGA